jgi:hypothetical protein
MMFQIPTPQVSTVLPAAYGGQAAPQSPALPIGPLASSPFFAEHARAIQELVRERQRDLNQDERIKTLIDSLRFNRRSDHVVRHLMQDRPVPKETIVRDILADRVMDQAVASVVLSVIEDRRHHRFIDQGMLSL